MMYPEPRGALSLDVVCIDLDGTLAEGVWPRPGVGKPLPDAEDMLRYYFKRGWAIVIHTARPWSHEETIWKWLRTNKFDQYVYNVVCGKPIAALYIDDRSWNPEETPWDTLHVNKMS